MIFIIARIARVSASARRTNAETGIPMKTIATSTLLPGCGKR